MRALVLLATMLGCARVESAEPPLDAAGDSPISCTAVATAPIAEAIAPATIATTAVDGCGSLPGTTEELAATPRSDRDLELLAIAVSGGLTADSRLYERLVRDINAVRGCYAELREVSYDGKGDVLQVEVDEPTIALMRTGDYHAWDCLNAHFGATLTELYPPSGWPGLAYLRVGGALNHRILESEYAKLTGVREVSTPRGGRERSSICARDGGKGTFEYLFVKKGGDCPSGCTEHDFYWFSIASAGAVTLLDNWGTHLGMPDSVPADVVEWSQRCHHPF